MLKNDHDEPLLIPMMSKTGSIRSRTTIGGNQSKSHDISMLGSKYESEINELRDYIKALETKNRKYLEIIGMTASEQQENMKLQVEAAQEALTFTKRSKRQ